VLDFGIAKRVGVETTGSNDPTAFMTQQGLIVGTVHYMSPEQALGKEVDARTDIFSLGVVLYEATTGKLPFRGETVTETITQIIRDEPEPPAHVNREVSGALDSIIRRCLRKDRDLRFATAADLAKALEAQMVVAPTAPYTAPQQPSAADAPTVARKVSARPTLIERPQPKRNYRWAIMAVTVAVAAAIAGLLAWKRTPAEPVPVTQTVAPTTTTAAPPPPAPATSSVTVIETPQPATTTVAPPPRPAPAPAPARSAYQLYDEGLARLAEGDGRAAHDLFIDAVDLEPHLARAHMRLGEMALFIRDREGARRELNLALDDQNQLSERERRLCELGLAILDRNRPRAQQLVDQLLAVNPNDPDVMRFRREFAEDNEPQPMRPRPFRRFPRRP
ncbi:MAG TPA: protein kinase, partial [Thermoanaerobaculia bacterium]|nr:protein kinase [Thermoanaerobaculia bacterium]